MPDKVSFASNSVVCTGMMVNMRQRRTAEQQQNAFKRFMQPFKIVYANKNEKINEYYVCGFVMEQQ